MRPPKQENEKTRKPDNESIFCRFRVFVLSCFSHLRASLIASSIGCSVFFCFLQKRLSCFARFRVFAVFAFSPFSRFRVFAFSPFSVFAILRFPVFAFSHFRVFAFSCFRVFTFSCFRVFVISRFRSLCSILLSCFCECISACCAKPFSCWNQNVHVQSSKCYGMDCFATCFTYAQSCDNVLVTVPINCYGMERFGTYFTCPTPKL